MKKSIRTKRYTGAALDKLVRDHTYKLREDPDIKSKKKELIENIAPYYPSRELVEAVQYARLLKRPLILRGEPGCGKTKLAQALAFELYDGVTDDDGNPVNYRDYYFEWFIKSTTKAVDGLFTFDHLARLRDIQLLKSGDDEDVKRVKNRGRLHYREFGPLGKAFLYSTKERPTVLLIDEIDKADIDFPNDLLLELDQKRIIIEETDEEFIAEESPIIIITSNDERELPNAFLRRCVFHYIEFPKPDLLLRIVRGRAGYLKKDLIKRGFINEEDYLKKLREIGHLDEENKQVSSEFLELVVSSFDENRKRVKQNPSLRKAPSTSELLDWLSLMHFKLLTGELKLENKEWYVLEYVVEEVNGKTKEKEVWTKRKMAYPEVLLKSLDDQKIGNQ